MKVFLGTCQAESLCKIYNNLICEDGEESGVYVSSTVPFGEKEYSLLSAADAIVNQVFSFEQAAHLPRSDLRAKIVDFPYLAGLFLWPFATEDHVNRQYFPDSKARPYDDEIGDAFLNRLIRQGTAAAEAVEKYVSMDIMKIASVARRADIIFHQQESRESEIEVKASGFIHENLHRPDLFLTRGHPGLPLLLHVARQVFEQLGIPGALIDRLDHTLIRVPDHINQAAIHPAIARHFELLDSGPDRRYDQFYGRYTFAECVRRYVTYDWNRLISEGIYFGEHGDNDRALRYLTDGLQLEPDSPPARHMLGRVLKRIGRDDEAIASMRLAHEQDPYNPYYAIDCSSALAASGDNAGATSVLRTALTRHPNFPDLNITLSHLLTRQEQIVPAIEAADLAMKYSAKVRTILPHLGRLLSRNRDFGRALEICARAVQISPQDADLRLALADALLKVGNTTGALEEYGHATDLAPQEVRYRIYAADVLVKSGRLAEAISTYLQVVQIDPKHRQAHEELTHLFARVGNAESAITHGLAALEQSPANPHLLVHLGNQFEKAGRLGEAASCFLDALIIDHRAVRVHLLLSSVLAKQSKLDEAICAAMNARNIEPANEALRVHLEELVENRKTRQNLRPARTFAALDLVSKSA